MNRDENAWTKDPLVCCCCGSAQQLQGLMFVNLMSGEVDWTETAFDAYSDPNDSGITAFYCLRCRGDHGVQLRSEYAAQRKARLAQAMERGFEAMQAAIDTALRSGDLGQFYWLQVRDEVRDKWAKGAPSPEEAEARRAMADKLLRALSGEPKEPKE